MSLLDKKSEKSKIYLCIHIAQDLNLEWISSKNFIAWDLNYSVSALGRWYINIHAQVSKKIIFSCSAKTVEGPGGHVS